MSLTRACDVVVMARQQGLSWSTDDLLQLRLLEKDNADNGANRKRIGVCCIEGCVVTDQ